MAHGHEDHQRQDRLKATAAQGAGIVGQRSVAAARNAKLAGHAIKVSHTRQFADAASKSDFVKSRAQSVVHGTAEAAAKGVRSGAREQLKGHFIETMTIRDYNLGGKVAGKQLVPRTCPRNPAYDATRLITVDGRPQFAGAVQIKSSSAGVEKAISQIEKVKPGSAKSATLLVSEDQVAAGTRKAAGRIRVKGNGVTRGHATKRLDQGIAKLADEGMSAASRAKALGKAGATGAVVTAAIGAVGDAKALKSGELRKRHFAENRAIDAAEGATAGAIGAGAASLAGAGATAAIAGTATGASVAAGAGAAGTAVIGTIGGMGTGGAAVAATLGTLSAPVVLPALAGVAASVAVGVGVSKVAKVARRKVKESRDGASSPPQESIPPEAAKVVPLEEAGAASRTRSKGLKAA